MSRNADHDLLTSEFMAMTGASIEQATDYLSNNNWDIRSAAQAYFDDDDDDDLDGPGSEVAPAEYTGPRTLDGRPAPQPIPSTSSSSKKPPKKKGLATLSSLAGGHAHDDDNDDSDDDDHDVHRDTYAGGEKSGLAVQDPSQRDGPRRIIDELLAKAKSNARRPEASSGAGPSGPSAFRGSGQTLGGEDTPSRIIPDPLAPAGGAGSARGSRAPGEVQERTLHLWRDGFSIDDGELRRFDDPANAEALRMIREGRAPTHLMNVRYDEPLDVKLQQHNEEYRPLPKVYRPFGGSGRRLGSPVPGESAVTVGPAPATSATTVGASPPAASPGTSVDESQPTIMIRIQMLDGTRLPARFNTSHTVNDVYEFISRASPGLSAGGWVLATTFPNKDHTDKSLVLGEMAEFKRGGTAVVKRNT
ncbi:SEP-domain-containing protein [Durotheca rogersii]|uniref:SEP-domain-containing protein n=1 Tax=Durotheca rogersii TaxID=419775 RepID=UPI00221F48AA|nr:SEP-domain-containing protein [Durotheca rogersii]KAI5857486.1 SEP-domain-containing protein [Durotheca rogersii]